ncbi:hypothetical protein DEJ16_00580 [Curtobacterium sp. MCJR17_055]|jgi:hypothetical protein|uniref:hypothetical protein n=1 Tax=unclassified Curtobacterium TaxID=257496 RepID=UPI000D8DC652|nr:MULTISPECIES: hypothetical protein [unclassified Curtobacterium]PYY34591.1 hypothetical protein DEI87_09320 [Curtobacterium sp. MCBD17_029]PYY40173.1 hypothetical protein DEJ32_06590 [Curtobacterium sp. MCPF17_046]PYY48777.1 hypothetical protein DEI84_08805 [Curtobacterium sp. MCBD17_023]PYY57593.1 hypothetical protein DEJ26_11770 [Curtobacterium sp. MCPF17_015]PYY58251.1 hypothetical protein DEJ16_00580 [Curtobacterium sp. MCJR17_055]
MSLLAEAAEHAAGVPAIVYPIVAACFFTFLGFVTWSFRDVAYRHSHKFQATRQHETGVDEFGHSKI